MPTPKRRSSPSRRRAEEAETLVSRALERQGWWILARNFRYVGCELDVVASKGETLIIVEVKARRFEPSSGVALQDLLPWRKRLALQRGAQAFLARHRRSYQTVRFDLAVVVGQTKEAGARPASIRYFVDVLA